MTDKTLRAAAQAVEPTDEQLSGWIAQAQTKHWGVLKQHRYVLDLYRAAIPAPPEPASQGVSDAARGVLAERERQVSVEGWTPDHDDEHASGSMAIAAACYALTTRRRELEVQTVSMEKLWQWTGWSSQWFKPKDSRSNLVRAGALILAEIERLDRAALPSQENERG